MAFWRRKKRFSVERLRERLRELRHDKIDAVRAAAVEASEALGLPEPEKSRHPNGVLATRTPVRERRRREDFGASEEVEVLVGPRVVERAALKEKKEEENSLAVREVRALRQQQEDLMGAIGQLTRAVESGMRTLNARVRSLEEQMQDLVDAVDEYREETK